MGSRASGHATDWTRYDRQPFLLPGRKVGIGRNKVET
ncbi:hypothetical protein FOIG_16843 [Fusarium odoratissimum NRRL 54006]|uniref:Uncharacterized protein n=1 Tax=Fusarium odoratissimum (strain NRRL 54006) TaxID=1089451 RepID=X0JYE1_FUSO5|nr:uncharacterized protein FOIG_16843 [Fusarium odoratissimum NRRL 54006]EXL89874.1 hypothetical protein FOIG_16843 [Fusarium odoratissimum NRRL 54006]